MNHSRCLLLLTVLFLFQQLWCETLFTNMNEATGQTTSWIVRSNVRYAHQFTAGGAATITTAKSQVSGAQKYPSSTAIRIHSDSSGTVGSLLGTLSYVSIDGSNVITYSGEVEIPSAGTYWFEIYPTAAIANHYYTTTASTSATGSTEGWAVNKDKIASGSNSISWSYFTGTPYQYPKFSLEGTSNEVPDTQTITTLAAAVDLSVSPWLTESGTILDLSGSTISDAGQNALEELTGLDGNLDSIDKTNITTLKLGGNTSLTTIPANIFATFTNLETLELHGNTGLTTITADAFNDLSVTNLRLDGNTNLTTLPENGFNGLTVAGTLQLNSNTGLTTIASGAFTGLTMTGNLRLDGNTGLTTIPANTFNGLTVGGDLQLNNNTSLATLPENAFNGIEVTGTTRLDGNTALETIATSAFNGATFGTLCLDDNSALTSLPTNGFKTTTINTDLEVQNTGLTSLSENAFNGATVSGNVKVNNNTSLTTIGENTFSGLTVSGNLEVTGNTALTTLNENAFTGVTLTGNLSLTGNSALESIPTVILDTFFKGVSITGDIRLDATGLTSLEESAFKETVVSNDLRIDNNAALTTIPVTAFQKTNVTNNLRMDSTGITKLSNETFKDTIIGNELSLTSNAALTEIEPKAFYNIQVTGNIDLENTTALTRIPWCAFDATTINGFIKLANSGLANAMNAGNDKTILTNGATKEQLKLILRKNPSLAAPVKLKEYAEIVKLQNKSLGIANASTN